MPHSKEAILHNSSGNDVCNDHWSVMTYQRSKLNLLTIKLQPTTKRIIFRYGCSLFLKKYTQKMMSIIKNIVSMCSFLHIWKVTFGSYNQLFIKFSPVILFTTSDFIIENILAFLKGRS